MEDIRTASTENDPPEDLTPDDLILHLQFFGDALDGIGSGMAFFDDEDCCQYWNRTFLSIFPEHAGHVYKGEPYQENLRRFYKGRLDQNEMPNIEAYIEAGVARHRAQDRPYTFDHNGQQIQVSSRRFGRLGRVRVWRSDHPNLLLDQARAAGTINLSAQEPPDVVKQVLDHIPDGLMMTNSAGIIIWVNHPFAQMYGLPDRTVALGNSLEMVFRTAWSDDLDDKSRSHLEAGLKSLKENLRFSGVAFELRLPQGRYVRVITLPRQDHITIYTHVDISDLKHQQRLLAKAEMAARRDGERAYFLATHDALTQVPNRMHANTKLRQAFDDFRGAGKAYAVLMLDIDHFKSVNDTYGHAMGDQVLCAVARTLRHSLREADFLARVGGEEFLVLLSQTSLSEAVQIAQSLLKSVESMDSPIENVISFSIGVAVARPEHESDDAILISADKALYEAKRSGRRRVVSFDSIRC